MNQVNELLIFGGQHWLLVALALVLLGLIVVYEGKRVQGNGVSAQELVRAMNHDDAVILDLRGRDPYKKGHILNAEHFPQSTLGQQMNKLEKYKDRPVILVDADGMQAKKALEKLKKTALSNVRVLTGGMRAWREASLPVHKG
jgi:rhodanese-related sulfurtransferase